MDMLDYFNPRRKYEDCWYRDKCIDCDSNKCGNTCVRYVQTDFMFQFSGIPSQWQHYIDFDYSVVSTDSKNIIRGVIDNVVTFVKNGFSLYLYGSTGTGKTSLAIKIMSNYFSNFADVNSYRVRGIFLNIPLFIRKYREHLSNPTPEWTQYLKDIETCDIVIFDDIFQTEETKFESQVLYSFINYRMFCNKCCIFTSNVSPEDVMISDRRIYSRICSGSDCIEFNGEDARNNHKFSEVYDVSDFE